MTNEDMTISIEGVRSVSRRIPQYPSDKVFSTDVCQSQSNELPSDVQKALTRTLEKNKKGLDLLSR